MSHPQVISNGSFSQKDKRMVPPLGLRVPLADLTNLQSQCKHTSMWLKIAKEEFLPSWNPISHQPSLACMFKCTTWLLDIVDITDENDPKHIITMVINLSSNYLFHRKLLGCSSSIATKVTRKILSKIFTQQTHFTCCTIPHWWRKTSFSRARRISWVRSRWSIRSATSRSPSTLTLSIISSRATPMSSKSWSWWSLTSSRSSSTNAARKSLLWSLRFCPLTTKSPPDRWSSKLM